MNNALKYEYFVRRAFGDVNQTSMVERGGDPASIAEADYFNSCINDSLNRIKIGTGYAIAIFNHRYTETKALVDPDDYNKMEEFLEKILLSASASDVIDVIEAYIQFESHIHDLPNRL
ncbi:MAG: hypothetical protein LBK57_00075 [Clostridiales Family XIII bacterium]|nr:hypothetical protein [Clostridiales Family XIII bacterium]